MSSYSVANVEFSEDLSRPSSSKGSVLANTGNAGGNFELVSSTTNGEVLTSDSAESSGVKWAGGTVNSGSTFITVDISTDPATSGDGYFLVDFSASGNPIPLVFPDSNVFFLSVNTNDSTNGWGSDPTRFNGGSFDLTVGFVAADTNNIAANFTAYSGGPHLSIDHTDIDTNANQFRSFTASLDIDVTEGQQVSINVENTLTLQGGAPFTWGLVNVLLLSQGT